MTLGSFAVVDELEWKVTYSGVSIDGAQSGNVTVVSS